MILVLLSSCNRWDTSIACNLIAVALRYFTTNLDWFNYFWANYFRVLHQTVSWMISLAQETIKPITTVLIYFQPIRSWTETNCDLDLRVFLLKARVAYLCLKLYSLLINWVVSRMWPQCCVWLATVIFKLFWKHFICFKFRVFPLFFQQFWNSTCTN